MRRATVAAILVVAAPARAEGLDGILGPLIVGELLIPDVRYERSLTASENRAVFSVPLVLHGGNLELGKTSGGFVFNHFAEVQYQHSERTVRGLLGERVLFHIPRAGDADHYYPQDAVMPFIEVAGLVGRDGSGAVIGGGLAWGDWQFGVTFGVVARYVITGDERRVDFALDFQVPLNTD